MGGDMISKWLSAGEIAGLISITKQSVFNRASKERWPSRGERGNGGLRRLYQAETLPEDVQTACAAGLKLSLQRLQSQLKPCETLEKKVSLANHNRHGEAGLAPKYKGRGGNGASLDERAKELIWFYHLHKNKPSIARVIRRLREKSV
jgi:hypothetical protein